MKNTKKILRAGWLGGLMLSASTLALAIDDGNQINDPSRVSNAGYQSVQQVNASSTALAALPNIISNGDFSSNTSSWACDQPVGVATCAVVNGQYRVSISDGGSLIWHIQPQQGNLNLVRGKTYTFAFDAKASANRMTEIKVERPTSPWEDFTSIGSGQSLTSSMQRFSYTFTMPESVNARMVMNIGSNNNDVTIDNIWLVEGTVDPCNGTVGCSSTPNDTDTDNDGVLDINDNCPTVAGPASNNGCPLATGGVSCDVSFANDWGNGAQLNTTISNNGSSTVSSWSFPMTFSHPVQITNHWNANITGTGASYEVSNGDWNGTINPNGSATFGFQITYSGSRPTIECGSGSGPNPTPTDSDNDGVIDSEDNCPNEAGPASNGGCPVIGDTDSDGDGVADNIDQCPNTPPGTPVDDRGCKQTLGYTAAQANALMGKGFNLGQMFESTDQPVDFNSSKVKIDAYRALGFTNVRIPITWTERHNGDYLANPNTGVVYRTNARLKTIERIVDYALSVDLFVVINMHHEIALKEQGKTAVAEQVWADVADIFKDRDNRLMFEILNEPHKANGPMAASTVRELTKKAYNKIRAVSADRIVIIGGNQWFAAGELAAVWPSLEGVGSGNDPYVMATFHHYDPWDLFHFEDTWPKDYAFDDGTVAGPMEQAQNWANSVGGIPLYIGEWGVGWGKLASSMTCNNIRHWYTKFGTISTEKQIATSVWDDSGWFKIFDNASRSFNNNLAQCIADGNCNWDSNFNRNNAGCYL